MTQKIKFEFSQLSDDTVRNIVTRDAVLWVGPGLDVNEEQVDLLTDLIGLPWRMVLSEVSSEALAKRLEERSGSMGPLASCRGFIYLVAGDPEAIELPRRSLPVFMLNGRDEPHSPDESARLPRTASLRRRLNMLNEVTKSRAKQLVIVSDGAPQPLEGLFELWEEGFRTSLVVISNSPADRERLESWLAHATVPRVVGLYPITLDDLVKSLMDRVSVEIPEDRLIIRVREADRDPVDIDITECEFIEHPILDRYELLRSHHVRPMMPEELAQDDFAAFFDRSNQTWSAFAAGLPWNRHAPATRSLFQALEKVAKEGSEVNRILWIASDSGAGGTTFARLMAFQAASAGFPTLAAREAFFRPEATEIASFLTRARNSIRSHFLKRAESAPAMFDEIGEWPETPWVIVFDVNHWDGHEAELRSFLGELSRSGRSVILVVVTGTTVSNELLNSGHARRIAVLSHELSRDQVLDLGHHLNRYLRLYGREKSDRDWLLFWDNHRPNLDTPVASFWIALEFWLKGQLDLAESVQSWLYKHFKVANLSKDLRLIILEIAALTIERTPLPEGLMPLSDKEERPFSVLLEEGRKEVPALALVRASTELQRQWAMAHDLLGRYLINSVFFDHTMLDHMDLAAAQDHVHLRLMLLRRVATRTALGEKRFLPLALEFAVRILKLDVEGNPEFLRHWRQVLDILDDMPVAIRKTSRSFNHHVAISRRRVATQQEFAASLEEKKRQLELAINSLEFALYSLERKLDDESDLNLYNSLSLAYQNLADTEREIGADQNRIDQLRIKASEAARRAFQEDPTNSYVLETVARNLIQEGDLHSDRAITCASEALGYIFQAVTLDRSDLRQNPLTRLANSALKLLRSSATGREIDHLCETGNPYGCLAKAWVTLSNGLDQFESYQLPDLPKENVQAALAVLNEHRDQSNWLILRFRYDLAAVAEPMRFDDQLSILDELEGTPYRMPLQLRLEHAILLYQGNRPSEASRKFRDVRRDLKLFDVIVSVPDRLRWLLSDEGKHKRLCNARVADDTGYRSWAKVAEFREESVPFRPEEFGEKRMPPRQAFKCFVTFGPNGPLLKPLRPEKTEN
jgi:hypothetical protein